MALVTILKILSGIHIALAIKNSMQALSTVQGPAGRMLALISSLQAASLKGGFRKKELQPSNKKEVGISDNSEDTCHMLHS